MEQSTKDSYLTIIAELEARRTVGDVTDEIESEYCARLDELWYKMSDLEIQEVERIFRS